MNLLNSQFWMNNLWHGENSREKNRKRHYDGVPFDSKALLSTLVIPNASRVWGADFSRWNLPPVNMQRMKDIYGMSFTIIKGCDGSLNTLYFQDHKVAAKAEGLPWGIYVWLYPNNKVSIEAQTTAWANLAKSDPPPLGVFIDAEWTTYAGQAANPSGTDLRMAHDSFKAKYGESAMTYTARGYADTYLKGFDWTREELWVANYGVVSPTLPSGATTYTFWQFSSTLDGKLLDPNGNAELDGNYFNGTKADFENRYLDGTQPPGGGTVLHWTAMTAQQEKACETPKGDKVKDIPANTFLEFDQISAEYNGNWARVFSPVDFAGKWVLRTYLVNWMEKPITDPEPPPPPPPTGDIEWNIVQHADGTLTGTWKAV